MESNDKFQEQNVSSFLKVFSAFVSNLKKWLNLNTKRENRIDKLLRDYKTSMDNYYIFCKEEKEFIEDFRKLKTGDVSADDSLMDTEEDIRTEHNKPDPPEHIKLTVKVLKTSLNYLPSKKQQEKLLVIDILKHGTQVISDWEDELLPIVHLIWSPLINRFKEHSDPLIVNRSFELLCVLATTSKDFIRKRTSE